MKGLLENLIEEKNAGYKQGLYHIVQINLAYNSNRIEGSTITEEQTAYMFGNNVLLGSKDGNNVNDIIEMNNHFIMFNKMLDTVREDLTEGLLKEFHRILKSNTADSELSWFSVGGYKKVNNMVGQIATTEAAYVKDEMESLLLTYSVSNKRLDDILRFHVEFESIHPFQDGNGRVGRLVMLRECLRHDITPFIVQDKDKAEYISCLRNFHDKPEAFHSFAEKGQVEFASMVGRYLHE